MKNIQLIRVIPILILTMSFTFLLACSDDDNKNDPINETLTESDITALLFMLEEEKLARDTYTYLNDIWSVNQFANIKKSEQTHMNAVENLLIQYNVAYNILPDGEFDNQDLQDFYDQFAIDGAVNQENALQIGATIEDLDIADLETNINATSNVEIISVFESLQCGSRNHLRSFLSSIEKGGNTYIPQFLSQNEYDTIIEVSQEKCN